MAGGDLIDGDMQHNYANIVAMDIERILLQAF
jgi:hypothetical protein